MNQVQVHPVFVRLLAHTLPGETLIETLDRLIATRAHATAGHAYSKKEARDARYAFAAAILSQPGQELRVSQIARHAIDGSYEIQQFEDLRERQIIYRVRRIGASATMPSAMGTSDSKGDSSMGNKTEKTTEKTTERSEPAGQSRSHTAYRNNPTSGEREERAFTQSQWRDRDKSEGWARDGEDDTETEGSESGS